MTAHSRNLLYLLAKARGITLKRVQKHLDISEPTASKYMREPKHMDGFDRAKMATLLQLQLSVLDRVINGEFLDMEGVLVANNLSTNQTVTKKTKK